MRRTERERQQTFLQGRDNLLAREGAGTAATFAKNADIARLGRDRIALTDNMTDRLNPGGELANMLESFLTISVEQPGCRNALLGLGQASRQDFRHLECPGTCPGR